MARWWDSISTMERLAKGLGLMAAICMGLGLVALPIAFLVAVPALVIGSGMTLCAGFAWFRWQHLLELERLGR